MGSFAAGQVLRRVLDCRAGSREAGGLTLAAEWGQWMG